MRVANGEYSRILNFLTWHGFDEFSWNDPAIKLLSSYGAPENSKINDFETYNLVNSGKTKKTTRIRKIYILKFIQGASQTNQ